MKAGSEFHVRPLFFFLSVEDALVSSIAAPAGVNVALERVPDCVNVNRRSRIRML